MRTCIITGPCLARTHGTGAQILRTFSGDQDWFHLYWSSHPFGRSEDPRSHRMEDPKWNSNPLKRIRHFVVKHVKGLWWSGNRVVPSKLGALQEQVGHADVAYVVIADEMEAERALSIIAQLRCPYVVHLMDVVSAVGLEPDKTPWYGRLLAGAKSVLVLNDAIAAEVSKFDIARLEVVGFAQDADVEMARPPRDNLQVLIAGNVVCHVTGMRLLAEAWPSIVSRIPSARVVYVGADSKGISPELKEIVEDRGYVTAEEYGKVVAASHIGYLPGPMELDSLGRYSIPSRISDFLMSGLPVVGCVGMDTAAERFMEPLVPSAASVARTREDISHAIAAFGGDEQRWKAASESARAFAVSRLSTQAVRTRVFDHLREAAAARD